MIKFRPHRNTPSASAKDEQCFENMNELFGYLFDHLNRIMAFIGSVPVNRKDIMIDGNRNVFINRNSKIVYIGEFEE